MIGRWPISSQPRCGVLFELCSILRRLRSEWEGLRCTKGFTSLTVVGFFVGTLWFHHHRDLGRLHVRSGTNSSAMATVQILKGALNVLEEPSRGSRPKDVYQAQHWEMAGAHTFLLNALLGLVEVGDTSTHWANSLF